MADTIIDALRAATIKGRKATVRREQPQERPPILRTTNLVRVLASRSDQKWFTTSRSIGCGTRCSEQGVGKGELRDQAGLGRESRRLRFEAAVADPGASVEQRPASEFDTGHHTETVRVADWRKWEPIGLVLVAETELHQPVAPVPGRHAEDLHVSVEPLLHALDR